MDKIFVFVGILVLLLITSPMFFDIYRSAAFNTTPRDDYAPYLLILTGQSDKMPGAPFAYRIISVVVAIPFYYILPTYTFTNLPDVEPAYLRATQALSFVSYVSIISISVIIYTIARKQYFATRASSIIVGFLTFFWGNFISKTGIDPFVILIIGVLVLWLKNPVAFGLLIVMSIGINEKIPIIFAAMLTCRLISSIRQRQRYTLYAQLFSSYLAVIGYFTMTLILKVPGNESQTNPALFLANVRSSLNCTFSLKGIFLNVLPVLVLLLVVMLAIKSRQQNLFHISDVSSLFVLLILAFIADVAYNVGRIVMYSYPLYLPAAASFIDNILEINKTKNESVKDIWQ